MCRYLVVRALVQLPRVAQPDSASCLKLAPEHGPSMALQGSWKSALQAPTSSCTVQLIGYCTRSRGSESGSSLLVQACTGSHEHAPSPGRWHLNCELDHSGMKGVDICLLHPARRPATPSGPLTLCPSQLRTPDCWAGEWWCRYSSGAAPGVGGPGARAPSHPWVQFLPLAHFPADKHSGYPQRTFPHEPVPS